MECDPFERKVEDLMEEVLDDRQVKQVRESGYFRCPASSQKHLAFEGGLAEHSYNVTQTMFKLNEALNLGMERNWIILAGLFHDLDKIWYYEQNILKSGKQSEVKPYKYNPSMVLPHGFGSVYILTNDFLVNVPVPVATAISWHQGEFQKDFHMSVDSLKKHPIDMIMMFLLFMADRYETWVKEVSFE